MSSANSTALGFLYVQLDLISSQLSTLTGEVATLAGRVTTLEGGAPVVLAPGSIENADIPTKTATSAELTYEAPAVGGGEWVSTYIFVKTVDVAPDPTDSTLTTGRQIIPKTELTASLSSLTSATTYYVFIYAYGPGGFSTEFRKTFTTLTAGVLPPAEIESITIPPADLTSTSMKINWTAPSTSGGAFDSAYVYISEVEMPPETTNNDFVVVPSSTLTYTYTGLNPDTTYYIYIFAYGPGGFSAIATTSFAKTYETLNPVTNLSVSAITPTSSTFTWEDPVINNASWIRTLIFLSLDNNAPADPLNDSTNRTIVDSNILENIFTNLTAGTNYYIHVYADGPKGISNFETTYFTTQYLEPSPPAKLLLTHLNSNSIRLDWELDTTNTNVPATAFHFIMVFGGDTAPVYDSNDKEVLALTTLTKQVDNLTQNTSYDFYVFAVNSNGGSNPALSYVATTLPPIPTQDNCWDNWVYDTSSNTYNNIGEQAPDPGDGSTFNDLTCVWDPPV
jgi:hypothetical protein